MALQGRLIGYDSGDAKYRLAYHGHRMIRRLLLAVFCCSVVPRAASAQSDRDRALQLFQQGKHDEALPLLEALSVSNPNDRVVLAEYGFALFGVSAKYTDPAQRKQVRAKARAALARARDLGDTSPVLIGLLRAIPEDGGGEVVFSPNPAVDSAMHRGEAAYSAADLPAAQAAYREALALDPQQYPAAVFIGDTYFRMNKVDSALIWYHNAIAINPHRELAHRYMSGVLLKNHRLDEARDEAIEAILAEPFNPAARGALVDWARDTRTPLGFPRIDIPPRDSLNRGRAAPAYDSVRREWRGTRGHDSPFARQYPADSIYRESLAEEAEALRAAAASGDSTVSTANIRRLADAGELESYIFFARASAGISLDYAGYFQDHHDALRRFWLEYVIGAKYVK
jgi:tetratricopeptide (TPR) repeat protein